MIGLIDYGAGNLHSAHNALTKIGASSKLVRGPADLAGVDRLVLPGVGACVDCVKQLKEQDLWSPLRDWLEADKPYFGICIGYQILFDHSEEFEGADGLGILAGEVIRFPRNDLKVPHMGWNEILLKQEHDVLKGLNKKDFYFVHSYRFKPKNNESTIATTEYGEVFPSALCSGNILGTQFHPEKSQQTGIKLLKNFLEWCP